MLATTLSASAMSYAQAREQALFLTDKMAYELNLTDDQYEAAYEINLDYLMRINTYNDLYGVYWTQRNLDLSYIMLDWQYRYYCAASYFYRPLYWDAGYWHFGIYARYPHRDYFFFGRPHFVEVYHGGHRWDYNGGRSWYEGRRFGGRRPDGVQRVGMRDGFNRGDYGRGMRFGNANRGGGAPATVQGGQSGRTFGGRTGVQPNQGTRSFGGRSVGTRTPDNGSSQSTAGTRSFGGRSGGFSSSQAPARSFGGRTDVGMRSSTRSTSPDMSTNSSSFGSRSATPSTRFAPSTRSASPSTPSRSFGGSSRSGGSSFGGNAPSMSRGGGSFGGGRSSGSFGGGSRSGGMSRSGGSFGGGHR